MTALLAIVRSIGEASAAAYAGADRIALAPGEAWKGSLQRSATDRPSTSLGLLITDLEAGLEPAQLVGAAVEAGYDAIWMPLRPRWQEAIGQAVAAGLRTAGYVPSDLVLDEARCEEAAALGVCSILIAEPPFTGRNLLAHRPVARLASLVALCRNHRIDVGFAGALERPDVPRILALGPDELGFDDALRNEAGNFEGVRLADLRTLMDASTSVPIRAELRQSTDRILVRDWTITMSIGAYARERGLAQRVRFTVEAAIASDWRRIDGMAGVVSYDLITDAIARCSAGHVDLVESLAEEIAAAVLGHPRAISIDITVEKLDVGPGTVGCRILRSRAHD